MCIVETATPLATYHSQPTLPRPRAATYFNTAAAYAVSSKAQAFSRQSCACSMCVLRSYHSESTVSHLNCEVKHSWVRLVLQWGTMWESRMLNCLFFAFCKILRDKTAQFLGHAFLVVRSYQGESTASHSNCEVKHPWAWSVLQWGTMWESQVLNCQQNFIFSKKSFFKKNYKRAKTKRAIKE